MIYHAIRFADASAKEHGQRRMELDSRSSFHLPKLPLDKMMDHLYYDLLLCNKLSIGVDMLFYSSCEGASACLKIGSSSFCFNQGVFISES